MERTVQWIAGCPKAGKTTLARARALELSKLRGEPILVLDSQEVAQFTGLPENTPLEAAEALWREPRGHGRVVPKSLEEVNGICRMVRRSGRLILLVDEAHFWLSAQSGVSGELLKIMRASQHCHVDVLLTTQHLSGDVPQAALSCTTHLCVFRCVSPRVLDVLERNWGFDREEVRNLAQFHYLESLTGF